MSSHIDKRWIPGPDDRFISASFNVVEMPQPVEGDAGSRLHLLAWGETKLKDAALRELFGDPGTVVVDQVAADMARLNFDAAPIKLHVNLDHRYPDGRAVGWISDIYATEQDGMGVIVDWTKEGRELISEKAYLYASGEFVLDRDSGRVVAIAGAALTNNPAADQGMEPVELSTLTAAPELQEPAQHGQKGDPEMDFKAYFARMFGRKIDDDGDAVEAVHELSEKVKAGDAAIAELAAYKTQEAKLTAELTAMTERATKAEAELGKEAMDSLIAAALTAGKMAPSQEDHYRKIGIESATAMLATIEADTFSPPGKEVTPDALNKKTKGLTKEVARQALADEIQEYSTKNKIPYSEAAVIVQQKGAH